MTELLSAIDGFTVTDVREVTVNECGRQMKAWLVEEQQLSPTEAGRRMWLARRLPFHPELAEVLVGEISLDHAQVILGATAKAL